MTNIVASGILLLLIVLIAFISVVHGAKAHQEINVPSDHYRGQRKVVLEKNYPRKDDSSSPNYHPRKESEVKSKQNNVIAADKMEGTLLKTKYVRADHRLYALDQKYPGVALYKEKYPTLKPRKHYVEKNENDNSIKTDGNKNTSNDSKKQHYHRAIEKTTEQIKYSSPSQNVSPSKVEPTAETNLESEDDSLLSNSTDFDILEASNGSAINESSDSNSTVSEKSSISRCPTCRLRDGDKRYRIEKLKQTILSSLHMTTPPNASKVSIPKVPALTHLYQMDDSMMNDSPYSKRNDNSYDDDYIVKTERVFTKARQPPSQVQLNITDSLYFAPPIKLYTCKIRTAYLWFYIRKGEVRRPYIHLTIQRILPESVPANRLITKTIFSQRLMRDRAFGWKRIDLRNVLRRWVAHPMSNHGLQIRALDDQGNNLVVLTPSTEVDRGYEPWLDTKVVEQKSHSRNRRSTSLRCAENSSESRCCRYPLYITFAEFGWEWIIAPNQVKADYCSGECRMTLQDETPHSWLHQQVPGSTGSCCSPTQLAALPLLYFDEDYNVLYQILQNMKVEECGCT